MSQYVAWGHIALIAFYLCEALGGTAIYLGNLICACAAAKRATGTRKGEQEI